jgi:hypothetical protein
MATASAAQATQWTVIPNMESYCARIVWSQVGPYSCNYRTIGIPVRRDSSILWIDMFMPSAHALA